MRKRDNGSLVDVRNSLKTETTKRRLKSKCEGRTIGGRVIRGSRDRRQMRGGVGET